MERMRTGDKPDLKLLKTEDAEEQKQRPGSEGDKPHLKSGQSEEEDEEAKTGKPRLPLPPNPLLPRKNIQRADVPRSGTDIRFM